jgi:hypothetical protein
MVIYTTMCLYSYKQFIGESRQSIDNICKKYGIEDYTINDDGTVDVDGHVNLIGRNLDKLPLRFGKVTGNFDCVNNKLTSLEGSPYSVGGYFYCNGNKLTSLEGCPYKMGGNFYCRNNQLTSLEGFSELYRDGMKVHINNNPVDEVYKLFDNIKAINIINEWEVIDVENMAVSYLRLSEVFKELGLEVPSRESIEFKHYTLVG